MAIEFARSNVISRSSGHSAVKAAAYRSGSDLMDERTGRLASYGHRADEVAHSEILLPPGSPEMLRNRVALWSAIETAEDKSTRRASAQLAIDHVIALPRELSLADQIALARDFANAEFVAHGVAVDLNVHLHSDGNPHAHLMTTTRFVGANGIGNKARALNGRFFGGRKIVEAHQLRHRWAAFQNAWAREQGIDLLVTNNDGQWAAEAHRGPTEHMDSRGVSIGLNVGIGEAALGGYEESTDKGRFNTEVIDNREALLANDASAVIRRIATSKSVFSRHDIYRELNKHISNPEQFLAAKARVDNCELLVQLTGPGESGEWFTTTETLDLEGHLSELFDSMESQQVARAPRQAVVDQVLSEGFSFLSDEQKEAVLFLTGDKRLQAVVGLAGSGKSTMLDAARSVWENIGCQVYGLALAGKAAEGLQRAANMDSSTIHSFLYRVKTGMVEIKSSDVFVLDEAGMVNSRLMRDLVSVVSSSGAKLVLVGDPDQLQPIQAGNPFRTVARRQGYVELETIRRQRQAWSRDATYKMARQETRAALNLFHEHRCFRKSLDRIGAIEAIVCDVVSAWVDPKNTVSDSGGWGPNSVVLAHANHDVNEINTGIRTGLIEKGLVKGDLSVLTADDKCLSFGEGDRILFKRNNRSLGVKNGTLGTVKSIMFSRLVVQLDGGKRLVLNPAEYADLAHGYAITIHKAQGVTVDRTKVLVTSRWDRHLSYVALSRHRDSVELYFGDSEFRGRDPLTKTNRPGLTEVMSRDASQVSVTDFAAQHGLEIIDYRAVELPAEEIRRRAQEAKVFLGQAIDKDYEQWQAQQIKNEAALADAIDTTKLAQRQHASTKPSGLARLLNGKKWDAQTATLATRLDTLSQEITRVRLSASAENQVKIRVQIRKKLERSNPRLLEAIAVLDQKERTARQSGNSREIGRGNSRGYRGARR